MKVLLKNIAIIMAGQGAPQGDENYCDNGIPFVKAGNLAELVEGKPITEIQKVSEEVAKKHRLRLYKKGSVLFAKSGMSCLKGYIYVLPQDAYVVSHLACVIPNEDISEYLKYYFEYNRPNKLIKDEAYPSISLADIGELKIDIKTQSERENIVRNLTCIAYLIELQKKQLQMFDDLIKSRFVEMFGDPILNDKGFKTIVGKEFFKLSNGKAVPEEKRTLKGVPAWGGNGISWYTDQVLFEDNTLVVGRVGFQSGNVHLAKGPLWITDNAMYISDFYVKDYDLIFLCALMEHIDFTRYQDAGDLKKITQKPFMEMKFIFPPIKLQNQFAAFVYQIDKLKAETQKKLEKTQVLFDSLMQQYFG